MDDTNRNPKRKQIDADLDESDRPKKTQRVDALDGESDLVRNYITDIIRNDNSFQEEEKKKRKEKWTKGLTKEQIKKMKPIMDNIRKEINKKVLNVVNILESSLPLDEKARFIEELNILKGLPKESYEYYQMKHSLYDRLRSSGSLSAADHDQLKELKNIGDNSIPLMKKILKSGQPTKIKSILLQKYDNMNRLNEQSDEHYKLREWIETALKLPTNKSKKAEIIGQNYGKILSRVKKTLDKYIYGQTKVKNRIMELVGSMIANPDVNGKCIVFIGKPGVGKSTLGRALSEALQKEFYQISLGGVKDESFIKGHGYTYIGSKHGEIANALITMGCTDGIIFFDEFDKIVPGSDISNSMLHILDPSQDSEFTDLYMPEIPIDLSRVIKIIAVNSIKDIRPALRSRLPCVKLNSYSISDKINIAKKHTIPRLMKDLRMDNIVMSDDIIKYIISKSKKRDEEGVRQLEQNLKIIFERINIISNIDKKIAKSLEISYYVDVKYPFILKESDIDKLFDENTYDGDDKHNKKKHRITIPIF